MTLPSRNLLLPPPITSLTPTPSHPPRQVSLPSTSPLFELSASILEKLAHESSKENSRKQVPWHEKTINWLKANTQTGQKHVPFEELKKRMDLMPFSLKEELSNASTNYIALKRLTSNQQELIKELFESFVIFSLKPPMQVQISEKDSDELEPEGFSFKEKMTIFLQKYTSESDPHLLYQKYQEIYPPNLKDFIEGKTKKYTEFFYLVLTTEQNQQSAAIIETLMNKKYIEYDKTVIKKLKEAPLISNLKTFIKNLETPDFHILKRNHFLYFFQFLDVKTLVFKKYFLVNLTTLSIYCKYKFFEAHLESHEQEALKHFVKTHTHLVLLEIAKYFASSFKYNGFRLSPNFCLLLFYLIAKKHYTIEEIQSYFKLPRTDHAQDLYDSWQAAVDCISPEKYSKITKYLEDNEETFEKISLPDIFNCVQHSSDMEVETTTTTATPPSKSTNHIDKFKKFLKEVSLESDPQMLNEQLREQMQNQGNHLHAFIFDGKADRASHYHRVLIHYTKEEKNKLAGCLEILMNNNLIEKHDNVLQILRMEDPEVSETKNFIRTINNRPDFSLLPRCILIFYTIQYTNKIDFSNYFEMTYDNCKRYIKKARAILLNLNEMEKLALEGYFQSNKNSLILKMIQQSIDSIFYYTEVRVHFNQLYAYLVLEKKFNDEQISEYFKLPDGDYLRIIKECWDRREGELNIVDKKKLINYFKQKQKMFEEAFQKERPNMFVEQTASIKRRRLADNVVDEEDELDWGTIFKTE